MPKIWRLTSLEILRCYVIKALYVPEVIETELKQPIGEKNVKTWAWLLLINSQWMMFTNTSFAHNVYTSSTWWFNQAGDPSSDLTMQLQYKWNLWSLLGLFFLQYASFPFPWHILSLWRLLLQQYMSNLQFTMYRCRYQHSCTGTGYTPWIQQWSYLHTCFLL